MDGIHSVLIKDYRSGNVASLYDVFVKVINGKTHRALRGIVAGLISPDGDARHETCESVLYMVKIIYPLIHRTIVARGTEIW